MSAIWTKDFSLVTFVNLVIGLNYTVLLPIIPLFAIGNFDSTPSEAGLAASIYVVGALVARPLSGRMVERIGRRRFLVLGLAVGLVAILLYFPDLGVTGLFAVRFLHGASAGVASTAASTIVASIVPMHRRGEGIGYFMLGLVLAMAVGPYLGIVTNQVWGFHMALVACFLLSAFGLVAALFTSVPEVRLTPAQIEEAKELNLGSLVESRVIPISISCGALTFCYSSVTTFVTVYAKEVGLADTAGLFFVVVASVIIISRPFAGRLFDSRGENSVMYPGIVVLAIGMFVLSQAQQLFSLLVAGALVGLGYGNVQTIGAPIAARLALHHRLGLAYSTFFTFVDIGFGVGPFVLGLLVPVFGYSGLYVCAATVCLASTFLYYLLHGRKAVASRIASRGEAKQAS